MLSCNHSCNGAAISTTRSEYVFVALVIQHAMRMRRIILPSVARPALSYFSALSHKRHVFREKVVGHKMRIFLFSTNFVRNISHSKKNSWNIIRNAQRSWCVVPVILAPMLMKLEFSPQIFQNYSDVKFNDNLSSRKRVVPCGRTDGHDEANSYFSQFCKRA
jgi:hypothetical protein